MENTPNQFYNQGFHKLNNENYQGTVTTISGHPYVPGRFNVGVPAPVVQRYQYPAAIPVRGTNYPYGPQGYPSFGGGYLIPRAGSPSCSKAIELTPRRQLEPPLVVDVQPEYVPEREPSKALGILGAICGALFVILLFGGTSTLLYGLHALWYGYAMVIGAAVLIFMSRGDGSKLYRVLAWIIAVGLCVAAVYVSRPEIEMSIWDNLSDAVKEILAIFGK
jgi:hypothetical protein